MSEVADEEALVEPGQPVVRFDLEAMRAAGYDPTTPVFVSNPDEFPVADQRTGAVLSGEPLFETTDAASDARR